MDKLTQCRRCGSDACYEQKVDENTSTWFCYGCGFTTSTLMKKNSSIVKQTLEVSPELYKDLMYVDQENYAWFPATVTLPGKGMVFVDGTSKKDWKWSAVKAIPLEEGDKKVSDDQTHKMDMKGVKYFKEKDFMDAMEEIGAFALED